MKMFSLKLNLSACVFSIAAMCKAQTDVLTQHNDLARTGWNPTETVLNTSNVTPTNFGILYKHTVDDQIYAQPLIATGITVTDPVTHTQVKRNLLIVVTVQSTMYAFDADDGTLDPYWKINFTPAGKMVPNAADIHAGLCNMNYTDFLGNGFGQAGSFGVVGTPVIDKSSNTIYFVSRYRELQVDNAALGQDNHNWEGDWKSDGFYQQVNAIDLSTGGAKFGSPALIDPVTTVVPGTGPGNTGNLIYFDPRRENQRGGLVLSNGIVYITYAGHCDMDNYYGWILGYKASDITQQVIRYVSSPNDGRGGIWMAGNAPAVDASGNLYFAAGNGTIASVANSPENMSLSAVKVAPDLSSGTLKNISWYKPVQDTYHTWNVSDLDMGTGLVLIPNTNMMVTSHKSGKLVLLTQNIPAPGGAYDETSPYFRGYYDLGVGSSAQSHSSMLYWGGNTKQYVYQFSEFTHPMAYPVNNGSLSLDAPIVNTSVPVNTVTEGGYASVSSNGGDPATGIVWLSHLTGTSGGTLHALKADDITKELWSSDQNASDKLGNYAKMSPPTIANGKVYVATFSNTLNVYGLLESNSRCITNIALNKTYSASAQVAITPAAEAFDDRTDTRWASGATGNAATSLQVDLGARFELCKVNVKWNQVNGEFSDYAVDFTIDISEDGNTWTSINTVKNNSFTALPASNEFNEHSEGRYVRINCTKGFVNGYSVSEFQIYGSPANNCVSPDADKMTVTNITSNSATLGFTPVAGITKYVIKYRSNVVSSYITRYVEDASGSGNPLTIDIKGLTCGFSYEYLVQSDCGGGVLSASNSKVFTTLACSVPCDNLTRYYHADLGDVAVGGMSCYSEPQPGDGTFTVTGAGKGLGGNGDQFQFNFTNLDKDISLSGRIATQDVGLMTNQAGLMMRDSITDVSRFIFIGKTGDNHIIYIYRKTPGAVAIATSYYNPDNASFFKIDKLGTQYGAFYGTSAVGPWAQVGSSLDLGFGNETINIGMAVSSTVSAQTTTAIFKDINENLTVLPVQLINFSANNEQNQYVKHTWQTAMEISNSYFQVERSKDGNLFDSILVVKSLGNSNTIQTYTSQDLHPYKGINFYRLKQVDSSGRFSYSATQTVKFGIGNEPVIYPNPVKSVFTAVPGDQIIREIVIYNLQGRAVQFVMGTSSLAEMKVNISLLANGVYFLKVKTDTQNYQYKIVKE